jgi:hypothetical protein
MIFTAAVGSWTQPEHKFGISVNYLQQKARRNTISHQLTSVTTAVQALGRPTVFQPQFERQELRYQLFYLPQIQRMCPKS